MKLVFDHKFRFYKSKMSEICLHCHWLYFSSIILSLGLCEHGHGHRNVFWQFFNSDWHISTSRDPSKKKYNHKSLLVGLYHDKKSWFRPKIKKLILARSQNHAFSNHAFSTLLRFQNNMLVRNLVITMHFLGVNGFLWMKSTS